MNSSLLPSPESLKMLFRRIISFSQRSLHPNKYQKKKKTKHELTHAEKIGNSQKDHDSCSSTPNMLFGMLWIYKFPIRNSSAGCINLCYISMGNVNTWRKRKSISKPTNNKPWHSQKSKPGISLSINLFSVILVKSFRRELTSQRILNRAPTSPRLPSRSHNTTTINTLGSNSFRGGHEVFQIPSTENHKSISIIK